MRYSSSKDERACTLVAAPPRAQGVSVIIRRGSCSRSRERRSRSTLKWESRKISSYSGTSIYPSPLEDRRSNSTDKGSFLKKGLFTNCSSNPSCFNWRCTRQILSVPLPPSSVYTPRRIDPRTIKCRWRATPSGRCVALPAEGSYDRVCPLERWKYIKRGWWLFFRSTDSSLPTVKISVWNERTFLSSSVSRICVYVYICNIFYEHTSWVHARGAHDQVFSADRTQPLVAEPGERLWYRSRYHERNLEIGQHAARVVRETGPNSSYRRATWKVLSWPSRRRRTSPCVLDTLCRSFDSHALLVGVPIVCFLCEVWTRNWRVMARRTRPSDRGLYRFPVNAIMMPEILAKVMIHRYVSTVIKYIPNVVPYSYCAISCIIVIRIFIDFLYDRTFFKGTLFFE